MKKIGVKNRQKRGRHKNEKKSKGKEKERLRSNFFFFPSLEKNIANAFAYVSRPETAKSLTKSTVLLIKMGREEGRVGGVIYFYHSAQTQGAQPHLTSPTATFIWRPPETCHRGHKGVRQGNCIRDQLPELVLL